MRFKRLKPTIKLLGKEMEMLSVTGDPEIAVRETDAVQSTFSGVHPRPLLQCYHTKPTPRLCPLYDQQTKVLIMPTLRPRRRGCATPTPEPTLFFCFFFLIEKTQQRRRQLERDPTLPVDRESDFVRRRQHEGGRSSRATTTSEKGTTVRERERESSLF